jgi:hypothetical protein
LKTKKLFVFNGNDMPMQGGKARAENLWLSERKAIAQKAAAARWRK